jgi:hypothetical protein
MTDGRNTLALAGSTKAQAALVTMESGLKCLVFELQTGLKCFAVNVNNGEPVDGLADPQISAAHVVAPRPSVAGREVHRSPGRP